MQIETRTILQENDFFLLEPEWDDFIAATTHPTEFLGWAWISAWWHCFRDKYRLRFVIIRDGDSRRLIAAAPLVTPGNALIRELSFIGNPIVGSDYIDLPVRHGVADEATHSLLKGLYQLPTWDLISVRGLRSDGLFARHAEKIGFLKPAHCVLLRAPTLVLPSTWDDLLAHKSKKFRFNLGYYPRKMRREVDKPVTVTQVTSRFDLARAIDDLVALHTKAKTAQGIAPALPRPRHLCFLHRVSKQLLEQGRLILLELRIGDLVVASHFGIFHNGTFSFYTTGFDPDWRRYQPGKQLVARAIQLAIRKRARRFDFLRGDEPYKHEWTGESDILLTLRLPRTVRGVIYVLIFRLLRQAAKQARRIYNNRPTSWKLGRRLEDP